MITRPWGLQGSAITRRGRVAAIKTLGRIGDPRAVPALIDKLKNLDSHVAIHAIEALGCIGEKRAVPALRKVLQIGLARDDVAVVEKAAEALGTIGDPQSVPDLVSALKSALKHERRFERVLVAVALEKIGDPQAVPALLDLLASPNLIRATLFKTWRDQFGRAREVEAVADAFKAIGTAAIPAVLRYLVDGEKNFREAAAIALGWIGDPQTVTDLVHALVDANTIATESVDLIYLDPPFNSNATYNVG